MVLLEMSFSGSLLILAIMAIRAVSIHNLPKKMLLVLWELALYRLLVPFTFPSVFSIYTFIGRSISAPSLLDAEAGSIPSVLSREPIVTGQGIGPLSADRPSLPVESMVWCAGLLLFVLYFVMSYLHCRAEFRTALPVPNAYAEQWTKKRSWKRQIAVRQSDRIPSPLTYGIIHPVILMPKKTDWEDTARLQYVFCHEFVHIHRFDAIAKLIATSALCIHWFNPLVWAMYILFNRDIELACDESVIRQFGEKSRSDYSLMLIRMEAAKSGLSPSYNDFSRNAVEERIAAIMNTKRMTTAVRLSACLIVSVTAVLFATSPMVPCSPEDRPAANKPQAALKEIGPDGKKSMSITHESADILCYEDGAPYIHDILTNNTDMAIVETQYGMLAYDEDGSPLKLYWNFLDSSAESSFENVVRTETDIPPGQTEEYRGGWSLYDGEIMQDLPKIGTGGANQAAYSLLCLKQVVFEDGTVWNNPDYEDWSRTYAGKETGIDELQNYYPHEYDMASD